MAIIQFATVSLAVPIVPQDLRQTLSKQYVQDDNKLSNAGDDIGVAGNASRCSCPHTKRSSQNTVAIRIAAQYDHLAQANNPFCHQAHLGLSVSSR